MFSRLRQFYAFVLDAFAHASRPERTGAQVGVVLVVVAVVSLIVCNTAEAATRKQVRHRRARVARVAHDFKGIPYSFGGVSRSGIDCSGLSMRVYNRALGIALPHSSAAQATYGSRPGWKRVWKMSRLRRGDLIFLAGTYKAGISHVGVVVGRGRSVEATSSGTRSRVVRWSSYQRSHFAFGIRPPQLRR